MPERTPWSLRLSPPAAAALAAVLLGLGARDAAAGGRWEEPAGMDPSTPAALGGGVGADPNSSAASQPRLAVLGGTTRVAPGQVGNVEVTIVVPPGMHVYKDMVAVEVLDAGGLALGAVSLPPGLHQPDPAAPANLRELYEFDAIIDIPVLEPPPPGRHDVLLSVRYQACRNNLCLFPQTSQVVSTLIVAEPDGPGEVWPAANGAPGTGTTGTDPEAGGPR